MRSRMTSRLIARLLVDEFHRLADIYYPFPFAAAEMLRFMRDTARTHKGRYAGVCGYREAVREIEGRA